MHKKRPYIWKWFHFWAYIHCTTTLLGIIRYSISGWWPVTRSDEYYLLTFAGATLCFVAHYCLKTLLKANETEHEFTFEELPDNHQGLQTVSKGDVCE